MNNAIEITDELLACYIEGNVTEEERAAVEEQLSPEPLVCVGFAHV